MHIAAVALDEKNKISESAPSLPPSKTNPGFEMAFDTKAAAQQAALTPAKLSYTVKRGDNLWHICRDQMRELSGSRPSRADLAEAVKRVAAANELRNPDFIVSGQSLDLTAVRGLTDSGAALAQSAPLAIDASFAPMATALSTMSAHGTLTMPVSRIELPANVVKATVEPVQVARNVQSIAPVFKTDEPVPDQEEAAVASVQPVPNRAALAAYGPPAPPVEAKPAAVSQETSVRAAAAALGGPDRFILGATPPLVPAGIIEGPVVAKLPGRSGGALPEGSRPDIRSLMEEVGIIDPEARIGLGSPWRRILDGAARITSGFGLRSDPFTGRIQNHSGLDIAAPRGTRIFPMQEGEVVFSGWKGGYGRTVVVAHDNGLETTYGHNSKNLVKVGERVTHETPLALVGSTGRSTGPHIHFEVRENGRAVDPLPLLKDLSVEISEAL